MNSSALIVSALERFSAHLPFPMVWSDLEARVVGANRLWLKLMGFASCVDVRGKTPTELYPAVSAEAIINHERLVLAMRSGLTREDVIHDLARACNRYFSATRSPLISDTGSVVGVLAILVETTETRLLQQASKEHGRQLQTMQEELCNLTGRFAHDLRAPLQALRMMLPVFEPIPETQRSILHNAVDNIAGIINRLEHTCRNNTKPTQPAAEEQEAILLSDQLAQVMTEARVQYRNRPVALDISMASHAQFAFARLQMVQFRRALTTLIANAVEALSYKDTGIISVKLEASPTVVTVEVKDNGKGMNYETLHRMLKRSKGLGETNLWTGMEQVWTMLDENIGSMQCETLLGHGTVIQLIFPRTQPPDWIAQAIPLTTDSIIVILDSSPSVHDAWQTRFFPYLEVYPQLSLHRYTDGKLAQAMLNALSDADKQRVVLLCDDQLQEQQLTGLQIIETARAHYAALVTSHYMMPTLRHDAATGRIKILPKQLAGLVPIQFRPDADCC